MMILVLTMILVSSISVWHLSEANAENLCEGLEIEDCKEPAVIDPRLKVEVAVDGLNSPTSMAFLGQNDILILEKNGSLIRAVNGVKLANPVHEFEVMKEQKELGLLGIAISKRAENVNIFVYITESEEGKFLGNRLYRYSFHDGKLSDEKMLLDFPTYSHRHVGGTIEIGPDSNVYLVIGDLDNGSISYDRFPLMNQRFTSSGGIVRITVDGQPAGTLDNFPPLNLYFAYGIRNSFGLDFDPITDVLWATENGNICCDEINRVESGFNSGWPPLLGIWNNTKANPLNLSTVFDSNDNSIGKYADPEFVWIRSVAPTALVFLDSNKLGKEYENDMFVGSANYGQIYHFNLNEERSELLLEGSYADKIADNKTDDLIFGKNFDGVSWVTGVTDLEVGPDGYLYVVALGHGRVYKIAPDPEKTLT